MNSENDNSNSKRVGKIPYVQALEKRLRKLELILGCNRNKKVKQNTENNQSEIEEEKIPEQIPIPVPVIKT